MEKIALLLLLVKKTLIVSFFGGLIGLGSLTEIYNNDLNRNDENETIEKKIIDNPREQMPPHRR